jgi:hypothetical protein
VNTTTYPPFAQNAGTFLCGSACTTVRGGQAPLSSLLIANKHILNFPFASAVSNQEDEKFNCKIGLKPYEEKYVRRPPNWNIILTHVKCNNMNFLSQRSKILSTVAYSSLQLYMVSLYGEVNQA